MVLTSITVLVYEVMYFFLFVVLGRIIDVCIKGIMEKSEIINLKLTISHYLFTYILSVSTPFLRNTCKRQKTAHNLCPIHPHSERAWSEIGTQ